MARRPFERNEEETDPAFAAFAAYRDLGLERSHVKVAANVGKSVQLIAKWSRVHAWRKRTLAYDMEVDRRKRVGDLKGVEDMRRRQIKIGLDLQELGGIELSKMLREAKKRSSAETLEQGLVMKLLDLGSKLERLNRGEPGEIVQNVDSNTVDLSNLTIEELKAYRAVGRKIKAQQDAAAPPPPPDSGTEGDGEPAVH
jgi:hypothetical protein